MFEKTEPVPKTIPQIHFFNSSVLHLEFVASRSLFWVARLGRLFSNMATFNGILPPRDQKETLVYPCLNLIGILGILEAILGLTEVCLETVGLTLYYELERAYTLEIWGLCIGFLVIFTGAWGWLTQLALIRPRPRHCMFLMGIFLTFVSGCAVFALLRYSAERTADFIYPKPTPFPAGNNTINGVTEEERNLIFGKLRASCTVVYTLLGFMFLASFMLNCKNIREIQDRGDGVLPDYRSLRPYRIVVNRRNSAIKLPGQQYLVDKNGSLWILPPAEQEEE